MTILNQLDNKQKGIKKVLKSKKKRESPSIPKVKLMFREDNHKNSWTNCNVNTDSSKKIQRNKEIKKTQKEHKVPTNRIKNNLFFGVKQIQIKPTKRVSIKS
jgi:hypothetical protein